MQAAYKLEATDSFALSYKKFENLTAKLQRVETMTMMHSEVEEVLDQDGRELLRQLLEDHLGLRAQTERDVREDGPLVGSDGLVRTHRRRDRSRGLMTIFGDVGVWRAGYEGRGIGRLYPLDAELNLPKDKYSHGVRKRVALEVVRGSFDESGKSLKRSSGAHVPKRQLESLAEKAARDFEEFYAGREQSATNETKKMGELMVLSVDGKGVPMRPEGLREKTRLAAERKQPKLRSRRSKGEKRHARRMATVAAVYTVKPHERTAEEIVGELRDSAELDTTQAKTERPRPENKRVWASLVKSPSEVIDDMFAEALRRDPKKTKQWVALADGNAHQLDILNQQAKKHGIELTIVLDIIHVLGYLWKAVWALHEEGSPDGEKWVRERLLRILQGHSSDVAAGMRRSATRRELTQTQREPIDTCANYLLNHREYLHYDQYLAAGLPIATGVIEGACRYLVKDRMEITGARWGLQGAEAILRLRALYASGDFDDYWRFHLKQEQILNHVMNYNERPPSTRIQPSRTPPKRPNLRLVE